MSSQTVKNKQAMTGYPVIACYEILTQTVRHASECWYPVEGLQNNKHLTVPSLTLPSIWIPNRVWNDGLISYRLLLLHLPLLHRLLHRWRMGQSPLQPPHH